MNLRNITLKYMGWCPGVESAARFLPDRDIPSTRIAFVVLIVASVSVSSYLLSYQAFTVLGITRPSGVEVENYEPKLAVYNEQLYIVLDVKTRFSHDSLGYPIYQSSSIYKAMLSLDGSFEDVEKILDLINPLGAFDILVSRDGRWFIAYCYIKFEGISEIDSDLYFIRSTDGRDWSEPAIVAEKAGRYSRFVPSLSETANGGVFLLFTNDNQNWYYSTYDETGWSPTERDPMNTGPSSKLGVRSTFLDKDERIAILGVDEDLSTPKIIVVKGILMSKDRGGGNWTEPRYLTQQSIHLQGYYPRMFYSSRHEGYFLAMRDAEFPSNNKVLVYFTKDLENWELRKYFIDAWEGSLIELPDGTLALVYLKIESEPRSTDLYLTTSDDGVSWTPPKKLELIIDEEALRNIPPVQVSNSSVVVSLLATVSALIILHWRPSLVLGKASMKEGAG